MSGDYKQLAVTTTRTRFYDGQYLFDQDFIDEQKYHIDKHRRHARTLHISGIAAGLEVTLGKESSVQVSPGTALDRDGRQIVLGTTWTSPAIAAECYVYITYRLNPTQLQQSDQGVRGETRLEEAPLLFVYTELLGEDDPYDPPDWDLYQSIWQQYEEATLPPPVALARLYFDAGKLEIDSSVRRYSGVRLPGGAPGEPAALRADDGGAVSLWMMDNGSLTPRLTVTLDGEVGIGTAESPANLALSGSLSVTGAATLARLSVNGAASATTSTVLTVRGQYYGEGHVYFYAHEGDGKDGTAYLQARDSTNKTNIALRLRTQNANGVNEALHITPDGSVGIGTTSPAAKLDVSGNLTVRGQYYGQGNVYLYAYEGDGKDGNAYLQARDSTGKTRIAMHLRTQNANGVNEALHITPDGNLGIGITAPVERLEVAGSIKVGGDRIRSADGLGIVQTNAKDWLRINPDEQYPGLALYKAVALGSGGLAVGEWSQLPAGQLTVTQSAFLATAGGGVGIGTATPGGKLNIYANGQTAGGWYEAIRFSQGAHSAITHPGGGLLFGLHGDRNFYFADIDGGTFRKYVMQINAAAGDVTMNYNLSVAGALNFGSAVRQMINLYDTRYGIGIQTNTQYYRTALNFAWYKGGAHSNNEFDAGGGTVQMVIRDGNVGIGTASPAAKLDIQGPNATVNIETTEMLHLGRPGTGGVRNNYCAGLFLGSYEASINGQARLDFRLSSFPNSANVWGSTADANIMTLQANGNVGIGTTAPSQKLEVVGDAKISGVISLGGGDPLGTLRVLSVPPTVGFGPDLSGPYLAGKGAGYLGITGHISSQDYVLRWGVSVQGAFVDIKGSLSASTKQFSIPHPQRSGYTLVHSCLEGPEVGVYYRGVARLRGGQAVVRLPDYFEALTRAEGRTVQLTPVGEQPYLLSYTPVADGAFTVYGDRAGGVFAWQVMAVRADVPQLEVEVENVA